VAMVLPAGPPPMTSTSQAIGATRSALERETVVVTVGLDRGRTCGNPLAAACA
jgi:hypothetical protein